MGSIAQFMTRDFLIAMLAAVSAGAVVFTLGVSILSGNTTTIKQRIKRVALEREKMRAEEMARLRGAAASRRRCALSAASPAANM